MSETFTQQQLEGKLYKELVDICKSKDIKVKGKKTDLINLILSNSSSSSTTTTTTTEVPTKTTKKAKKGSTTATPTVQQTETTVETSPPSSNKKRKAPETESTESADGTTVESSTTVETTPSNNVETSTVETTPVATLESSPAPVTEAPATETSTEPEKDGDPDNEVVALRMARENCNTGELHASLIWHDIADLDLHVITPSGEHLYYGHKESRCGGWLDRDMNAGYGQSTEPIENIFWASAPSGKYKIYVNHFNCHCNSEPRFSDRSRSVPFRVRLIKEGKTSWFNGSASYGQNIPCFEFTLNGKGAVGSFVVIPPNNVPSTFKELCEKNRVSYSQGEGYYALKKKEDISEAKDMVLHDTVSDTFTIGHVDVCTLLNQPTNKRITLTPSNLPPNCRLFVQSTSHNRKIPADTHVLMKVSVREALSFRHAAKYNFK